MLVVVAGLGASRIEGQNIVGCDASDPAAILDRVRPGDEPTLVIGESRQAAQVRGQAAVLGDRDEDRPLAVRVLPHGPLAVRAIATHATEHWQDQDPGLFVHLCDVAASFTLSATWLPSVGKLDDPAPTLGQHIRSWLPGASYVVLHHPLAAVVSPAAIPTSMSWPGGVPAARSELQVSGVLPAPVLDRMARLAGASSVRTVQAGGPVELRFGTARAIEICALPDDARQLAGPVSGARCPSCQLLSPNWLCAFCKRSTAPLVIGGHE